MVRLAKELGREPATIDVAKEMLGLKKKIIIIIEEKLFH